MSDPRDIVISATDSTRIFGVMNAVMPRLDRATRKQLLKIRRELFMAFGEDGLFKRINNKSVAAIISEFKDVEGSTLLAFGGVGDDIEYKVVLEPNAPHPELPPDSDERVVP